MNSELQVCKLTIALEAEILRGGRFHFLARTDDALRICRQYGWNWKLGRVYPNVEKLRGLHNCIVLTLFHTGFMKDACPKQIQHLEKVHGIKFICL